MKYESASSSDSDSSEGLSSAAETPVQHQHYLSNSLHHSLASDVMQSQQDLSSRRPSTTWHVTQNPLSGPSVNGLSSVPIVEGSLYKGTELLADEIKSQLQLWHEKHGSKHPPVYAERYAKETKPYKAFGPHGEELCLRPYEIRWGRVKYGIWVLRRTGHPDAAVRFTKKNTAEVYYGVWVWSGDDTIETPPVVVKIFLHTKTGDYPFVFEHHAPVFGLTGTDEYAENRNTQVPTRGMI